MRNTQRCCGRPNPPFSPFGTQTGRIEDSYGDEWPWVTCIDYWIYVDPVTMTARLSAEGWSGTDETVDLTGDGRVDGRRLASAFAHILGVALPHQA